MTLAQPTAKSVVDAAIAELNLGDVVTLDQTDVVLESERNAANGFLGLTGDGSIEAVISIRQGTEAELDDLVPADGELLAILDSNGKPTSLRLGDGTAQLGNVLTGTYTLTMPASLTLANSTTYEDVSGLVLPVLPNEVYEVFLKVYWLHTVDGIKFRLLRSSANMDVFSDSSNLVSTGFPGTTTDWEFVWSTGASVGNGVYRLFHFIVSGRSGLPAGQTLKLQTARNAASNASSLLLINTLTNMTIRRLV